MRKFNPEKELYKIQHNTRDKIFIGAFLILLIISISSTYALYQVRYSKRIIYTKVAPFSNKDIQLAIYLDDAPSTDNLFPEKNSGYLYSKTVCDNGSRASFDNVNWELNLKSKGKDKCDVYFVTNKGEPNPPELYKGLIPVTFDESGKVLVANLTNNDWYNYDAHQWANAVLVNTTKYNDLVYNGLIKEDRYGTEISMSDILQMYVWIPRYKYQLFNAVNGESVEEQEIKIQFEGGTANTGEIECRYTNNSNGTITEKCTQKGTEVNAQNGDWYTHPAFTFKGTFDETGTELTGIWVGKFEPSGSATALTIKPNMATLSGITIKPMFDASRNIEEQYANTFNLDKTQIDTHMMKNIDWGAITYLAYSKYGRCEENNNCVEITSNGNTSYRTGYANTGFTWETTEGQGASTTGNMSGIYDTSGGAWECVMGNIVNASGAFHPHASGFTTAPNSRYYDVYEYASDYGATHHRGHLGDVTRETLKVFGTKYGGWYDSDVILPGGDSAWFMRGGAASTNPYRFSSFSSTSTGGGGITGQSFRIVITAEDK